MPSDAPIILAFDTSAAHCAAALMSGNTLWATRHVEMRKGQAEALMPLIAEMLADKGVSAADISAIGVCIGPGNFTGIRISVSAARGMALALGIPAVGVSALQSLAFGCDAPVLCSVDARRDMFYAQVFNSGEQNHPVLCDLDTAPLPIGIEGIAVIGHRADELAALIGGKVRQPKYPMAEAIARNAALQMHDANLPRPAPLYLRAADAAPARDTGPVLL